MPWLGIHGHDTIVERFRRCLQRHRLASTFLFVGPRGIGKCSFALSLARALLCQKFPDEELDACGTCPACQQVAADSHPDLELVGLPDGKNFIPLERLIGDKDHRMREGLCHRLSLKPAPGSRKIAIINDADYLNREGANCLLKTLEEPPPRSLIFLIGTSQQRQLPTIRSRAQVVRFQPLSSDLVARLLLEKAGIDDALKANQLAKLAAGSLATAMEMADSELFQSRRDLLETLSRPDWDRLGVVRKLSEQIDAAGKQAPVRRTRTRQLIDITAEFYRQLMRALNGCEPQGDDCQRQAVTATATWWCADAQVASDAIQRCLDARSEVDANANQATLLSCWIDDLAEIARGQHVSTSSR
jgi:DNA polymerase-3 subunit delta'